MSRELMPKSGIMMPHVVVTRDAAVVGVSTVDGQAGAVNLTDKYLQKTDAAATYQTKVEGASKDFVLDSIQPIMSGALFRADPWVVNDTPFRSTGANGVESVDMMKVTPDNSIKIGSYASSVQGVEIHSAGRLQVVDQNDSGVETKYPVYSKRYRPEIEDLPFAAIGSYVKDSKGRTVGVTRTGINSDIKQLTQKVTFTQPVTVPDAVGDYDAVTLRQLRNSGGGSGGPTMSGISNFGIGDFRLVDSRAFIQSNDITSDGQLLNRADWPELWAYAQMLSPIADADWLADPQKRGRYSLGNGTTTFRVPDRNGVQAGSIQGLFGRGDGGTSSEDGKVYDAAAPNISGSIATDLNETAWFPWSSPAGVFTVTGDATQTFKPNSGTYTLGSQKHVLRFDASRESSVYGRYGITAHLMPRNFVGVWVIRASGGFTAANTSWSVINQDSTKPSTGVTANGGEILSQYKINGVVEAQTSLRSRAAIGGDYYAQLNVYNRTTNRTAEYKFDETGTLYAPRMVSGGGIDSKGGISLFDVPYPAVAFRSNRYNTPNTQLGAFTKLEVSGQDGEVSAVYLSRHLGTGAADGAIYILFPTTGGTLALQGTSGLEYKKDIKDANPKEAFDRISNQRLVNFVYKDDEQERVRFGVIAEEAEVVAPQYIKHNQEPYEDILDEDGNKIGDKKRDRPSIDTNPIVMDLIGAVHYLRDEVEQLKAELAELKASK